MFFALRSFTLAIAVFLTITNTIAQDCSIPFDSIMFAVQEEHDIYYGSGIDYDGNNVDLRLNLFKPIGDGQTERPLIIVVHGGGFFQGHRDDRNDVCQKLASMGWAAASISYRLDFHGTWLLASPFSYDPAEVVRAAYRAQQDVRGAVRFLKSRSVQDSTSTENVMLWGYSAGAIASLHAALVDDQSEKPPSCYEIGDVYHIFSNHARPDLGPFEGLMNLNGFSEEVIGVASHYGGLLDTNLVTNPLDPALYLYHQTGDPIVGCSHQQGLWDMPLGVGDNYPWLYGSCVTDAHIQSFSPDSGRYQFHEYSGNEHDVHDPDAIFMESVTFLRNLFCGSALQVSVRVFLGGPYDVNTGLMNDALRTSGEFPLTDPYPAQGYVHVGTGNDVPMDASLLSLAGNDAIVDRVILELRSKSDSTIILESRSVLLQRDGDVVDIDGVSSVRFDLDPDNYYLAVRHRNHLGIMSANTIAIGTDPTMIDLTTSAQPTYGIESRMSVTGQFPAEVLWPGDVNFDQEVKYTGLNNDRDVVLIAVGGIVPTNTVSGYEVEDVDLDGVVKYTGSNNDRDIILQTIGGIVPTNILTGTLP